MIYVWDRRGRYPVEAGMIECQSTAIPYRREDGRDLEGLLVSSRRQGRWVLPKGGIRGGILLHKVALQEAFEEAGVLGLLECAPVGEYTAKEAHA